MSSALLRKSLHGLIEHWSVRSRLTRQRLGDAESATLIDRLAAELLATVDHDDHRWLSVQEAACRAGRRTSTIRRYITSGRLPNVGRRYAPRVRLSDLRQLYPEI
jgi:hypothetical protein